MMTRDSEETQRKCHCGLPVHRDSSVPVCASCYPMWLVTDTAREEACERFPGDSPADRQRREDFAAGYVAGYRATPNTQRKTV